MLYKTHISNTTRYKTHLSNTIIRKRQKLQICYFSLAFPDKSRFSPDTEKIKEQLDNCAPKVVEEIQGIFPIPEIKLCPEILHYSNYQSFSKKQYSMACNIIMNCDLYRFILEHALMPCRIAFLSRFNSYDYPIIDLTLEFPNEREAEEFANGIRL